jgi:hypothetical protein
MAKQGTLLLNLENFRFHEVVSGPSWADIVAPTPKSCAIQEDPKKWTAKNRTLVLKQLIKDRVHGAGFSYRGETLRVLLFTQQNSRFGTQNTSVKAYLGISDFD